MMALGETSYKYTTVTCILLAAVIHMLQTQSFPEWSFSAFDLNLNLFIPTFDFSCFDLWFYIDILTYTTVSSLANCVPAFIFNFVFTVIHTGIYYMNLQVLVFDSGGTVESILAMTRVSGETCLIDSRITTKHAKCLNLGDFT